MNTDISVNNRVKRWVAQAIYDAISRDVPVELARRDYPHYNMPWVTMWNNLGANLKDRLDEDNAELLTAQRGPWFFSIIYLPDIRTVLTIMNVERFQELQRTYGCRPLHYLDLLIQKYNHNLPSSQTKLDIPELLSFDGEIIEKELQKLCPTIKEKAENHVLVVFTKKDDQVFSIEAIRISPEDMSIYAREEWISFITESYEIIAVSGKVVNPQNIVIDLSLSEEAKERSDKKSEAANKNNRDSTEDEK